MPRTIVPSYAKVPRKRIVCMGDSLTSNNVWGVNANKFYPRVIQDALNALGADVLCRNLGVSGEATGQMIARKALMTQYEVPDLAVIYAGANDLSTNGTTLTTAATTATTTQFSVTAGSGVRFPAGSWITISSQIVQVTSQVADILTVSPALSSAPTTGTTLNCETQKNLAVLANFLYSAGCTKILIVGRHYDNFSTGADTTSVQTAGNLALRNLQIAAVNDINAAHAGAAAYVDMYAWMADLITTAVDTQGSFSWHVLDSNVHLNIYGEQIVANAIVSKIQAQSWLTAISS